MLDFLGQQFGFTEIQVHLIIFASLQTPSKVNFEDHRFSNEF